MADSDGSNVGQSTRSLSVVFDAEIKLTHEEIREASGDLAQAVQNQIGHTGAQVIEVDELRSDSVDGNDQDFDSGAFDAR